MKKKLKKCCRDNIQKLLERIKLEKKKVEYRAVPDGIEVDSEKNEGYNQAIADLEKLKESIKKELKVGDN